MKTVIKVFSILFVLVVLPSIALGQISWHMDQLIENNAGFGADNAQVAVSGNNVVAVWSQSDGTNARIYSNYSTNGGASWGTDQLIENNAGAGLNAYQPQVAISGNNVVAVWRQFDGANSRVYSNYSTDGGATWGADQLIENNTAFNGNSPQVAISGNNVVAVWYQSDGTNSRIYANYSTNGGATWGADQLIENNAGIGLNGYSPEVAISGTTAVAVWDQWDGTNSRIYANYSTNGGATWGADQVIENNSGAGLNGGYAEVVISGNNVVAVWRQSDGSNTRIYSNYSINGGVNWGTDQLIEDNSGNDGFDAQIAISGNSVSAVWRQGDGANWRIYSNYSTDGGATWGSDRLIEDNSGNDGLNPQIAMSGNNVVAVWEQSDGSNPRIYSNYSTDGGATWGSDRLIENNIGFDGSSPQVAISGDSVVAVWEQSNGNSDRIYSNYGAFGGLLTVPVFHTTGAMIFMLLIGIGSVYSMRRQGRREH